MDLVTLYRPVGSEELALINGAGMEEFPTRLPDQPIFYPVTNEAYATQIARYWNTKHGSKKGYVTRFDVDATYLAQFEKQIVGGAQHEEYGIPAEDLDTFNGKIVGKIEVIAEFIGENARQSAPSTSVIPT